MLDRPLSSFLQLPAVVSTASSALVILVKKLVQPGLPAFIAVMAIATAITVMTTAPVVITVVGR